MTQDKAENLLFAVEDRQFVLGKTSHWMKYLAEQVKDAREEAFSHYNAKSQLTVNDVFQAWWHMRRAQENLHQASVALKRLGALEELKWERLYDYLERCGDNA